MDWLQLIVLSLLQGFTEFLPISSSAHLILPAQLFGWTDQGLAFDVAVHVGTLLAVVLYFRRDVAALLNGWSRSLIQANGRTEAEIINGRMAWYLLLATIPAGLAGVLLDEFVEQHLRSTAVIATTTILFGLLLGWADRRSQQLGAATPVSLKGALLVGLAQVLALIPGTSRSGITMTMALALGWSRVEAARFSFLLSIPIIVAAGGLKAVELIRGAGPVHWNDLLGGMVLSFGSAFLCIHFFLKFLESIGFMPFVIYRLVLGLGLFLFILFGAA